MKSLCRILGLVLICLFLSVVYSYADSAYGTMWKQEDTIVYPADDVTKIDFNNISGLNLLGVGGGVTEGSDVGFANLTSGTLKTKQLDIVDAGGMRLTNDTGSELRVKSLAASNVAITYYDNVNTFLGRLQMLAGGIFAIGPSSGKVKRQTTGTLTFITNSGSIEMESTLATDIPLLVSGAVSQTANLTEWQDSTNNVKAFIDKDGSIGVAGVYTAFRNLSSATETLTSADYFIKCLANDNEVVITMPPVDASYSQTLMFKYTDSGSTNKCKLDGNGAEQVEGFDVYSGLDTYREGCTFKSDEAGWWITGCI